MMVRSYIPFHNITGRYEVYIPAHYIIGEYEIILLVRTKNQKCQNNNLFSFISNGNQIFQREHCSIEIGAYDFETEGFPISVQSLSNVFAVIERAQRYQLFGTHI